MAVVATVVVMAIVAVVTVLVVKTVRAIVTIMVIATIVALMTFMAILTVMAIKTAVAIVTFLAIVTVLVVQTVMAIVTFVAIVTVLVVQTVITFLQYKIISRGSIRNNFRHSTSEARLVLDHPSHEQIGYWFRSSITALIINDTQSITRLPSSGPRADWLLVSVINYHFVGYRLSKVAQSLLAVR